MAEVCPCVRPSDPLSPQTLIDTIAPKSIKGIRLARLPRDAQFALYGHIYVYIYVYLNFISELVTYKQKTSKEPDIFPMLRHILFLFGILLMESLCKV